MTLKIFNTLGKSKQIFKSIKKGKVGIYTCGPTVYNYVHIGNLRAYIFSDILRRFLEFEKYKVKSVMNLTDVDDKTIKQSQEEKKTLKNVTKKYELAFKENLKELNIKKPTIICHATEHVSEMVKLVKTLLEKGIAYKTKDGIYFSISNFNEYGKLSGIKKEELRQGASNRVLKDEYDKGHTNDFALWKFYTQEDGDIFWETEIGKGRPGWHIECSAMSMKYLGNTFDFHLGGVDLIFPHHENEIAQSEAATGKKFVNYWMHNEWVLVNGKKMSKSLNNFYKLSDVIERGFSPLDLRYFYLNKLYRQQFNFTWKGIESSKIARTRLEEFCKKLEDDKKVNKEYLAKFITAMEDDLNSPKSLQVLWRLVKDEKAEGKYQTIKKMDEVFGLDLLKVKKLKIPREIKVLIKERETARKNKNWLISDKLRDKINELGYAIDDTEKGTKIRKK